MSSVAGFEPVTEVTADDRARIAFGRIGVRKSDRYLVSKGSAGEILLTPMASIPQRELLIWENEGVRESLMRGLADAAADRVGPRDDFLDAAEGDFDQEAGAEAESR